MSQSLCWSVCLHPSNRKVARMTKIKKKSSQKRKKLYKWITEESSLALFWISARLSKHDINVCTGHLQCADKKSEVRFMVSLHSSSIDGLDMGAQLPKVVKVNQLLHTHPLAFEARQKRVIYSDGGLLQGAFAQDIWQPKSTHKTNPLSDTP